MNLQLVIFSPDAELIKRLESQNNLPYISYAVGYGPTVSRTEKLDALKVSQMEAVERFHSPPPHPLLEARVLKTPWDLLERGLPKYAISGVSLPKDYPRNSWAELELVISATLKAIKEFNLRGEDQILRVGLLPADLGLLEFPSTEVFQMIDRIYRKMFTE